MSEIIQDFARYGDELSYDSFNHSENSNHVNGATKGIKFNKNSRSITEDDFHTLQNYFKEIGTEELLTAKDEIVYSIKIKLFEKKLKDLNKSSY